jgi:hypothetical protein
MLTSYQAGNRQYYFSTVYRHSECVQIVSSALACTYCTSLIELDVAPTRFDILWQFLSAKVCRRWGGKHAQQFGTRSKALTYAEETIWHLTTEVARLVIRVSLIQPAIPH